MKTVNIFLSILILTILSCSDSTNNEVVEQKTEISTENVMVADYAIDGMVCAMGCAKTIQDELADMNGIASCNVDFESGKAHVEYDKTQLSENDVIAVIEGLADGKYKVSEWKEEQEELDDTEEVEGEDTESSSITEVSLPSFEIPNLFHFLFNQL